MSEYFSPEGNANNNVFLRPHRKINISTFLHSSPTMDETLHFQKKLQQLQTSFLGSITLAVPLTVAKRAGSLNRVKFRKKAIMPTAHKFLLIRQYKFEFKISQNDIASHS